MWQDVLTAAVFYMPFVMTIGFALFVFLVGFVCLLSGTFFVLVLAGYGIYSLMRDSGLLSKAGDKMNGAWSFLNKTVLTNIKESFVLANPEQIPNKQALYICSPHGLVGYSWFFHLSYCLSPWPETSPRPLLAVHSILFRIPFAREILAANRCIEASDSEISKAIEKGNSVAIVIGGVEEMTHSGQEVAKLILKKRKGYIRLAKQFDLPIVPLYAAGENELFSMEKSWVWRRFSTLMYQWLGIQFPLPSWSSMKHFASIVKKPLDTPVKTFVVEPIETHNKDVRVIQTECIHRIQTFLRAQNIAAEIIA
jgi:hypothetical protein